MGFEPQVVDVLNAMFSRNLKPQNEDEEFDKKKNVEPLICSTALQLGSVGFFFYEIPGRGGLIENH